MSSSTADRDDLQSERKYRSETMYYRYVDGDSCKIHMWLWVHRFSKTRIAHYDIFVTSPYLQTHPENTKISYLHESNVGGEQPCWLLRGKHGRRFYENGHVQSIPAVSSLSLQKCNAGELIGTVDEWRVETDTLFVVPPRWLRHFLFFTDPKYKFGYGIMPFGKALAFTRIDAYWLKEYTTRDTAARCIQKMWPKCTGESIRIECN